ncbi:MAG: DUF1343 domain-containing protein, partial [Anaerolineae bacterium]|nr:DUF1343 domain-containing protein [Anaerolineae bacterium]
GTDRRTGLPVYSLYGASLEPTPEMLAGVDLLLYDMQDVGARYYTLISTLAHVLRGACRAGRPVVVLDRPNPINGLAIEGPPVEPGFESFVGILPVPIRHGLTAGELARYAARHFALASELTVVPMQGWTRRLWFDETGLPWVPTSPAMPRLSTATLYPGTCLLEGTNLSEGRGTALPFELAGAPWLEGHRLARALNGMRLPGVRFRPVRFVPCAGKHAGQACGGVQVHVTDREAMRPLLVGLHLIAACLEQAPERFHFLPPSQEGLPCHFDLLAGTSRLREGLEAGVPAEQLAAEWAEGVERFSRCRQEWLIYA